MDNAIRFGAIHVVEWLRPADETTGAHLTTALRPIASAARPAIEVKYWRVESKAEFLDALRQIGEDFQSTGRIPLLHIETHGSQTGIGPSADNGIDYPELMEALIPLNRLTGLNLVVVLAACEGFYGVQMLQPDRREAAFRGLIGPNQEVESWEISTGCTAFYQALFGQLDGDSAFKTMNDSVDGNAETFWMISVESVFKIVYRGYLATQCTAEAIEGRARAISDGIGARRRAAGMPGRFRWEIERDIEAARLRLNDQRSLFEQLRREFFFIDEFPGNSDRFDLTFEQCQPQR